MSLVEVIIVVSLLGLLLGLVFPLVSTIGAATRSVTGSLAATDQLQEPATILTQLITEAVAPAPEGSSTWWAVFQPVTSSTELAFTANVGPLGQELQQGNQASTITGPALITVAPRSVPGGGQELVGSLALPQSGTCPAPGTTAAVSSGCQYPGWQEQLFVVPNLQSSNHPLFQFLLQGSTQPTTSLSTTCTENSSTTDCDLDQVEAVLFDIEAAPNGSPATELQNEVWLASPNYNPELG
jgi:hypothetical protein